MNDVPYPSPGCPTVSFDVSELALEERESLAAIRGCDYGRDESQSEGGMAVIG